jgi:Lon protease-like protein
MRIIKNHLKTLMTLTELKPLENQVKKKGLKILKVVRIGCQIQILVKVDQDGDGRILMERYGVQVVKVVEHTEVHTGMYKPLAAATEM